MFACICHAVTEDQVRDAIDLGATTLDAVATMTQAGTGCGSCQEYVEDLIDERCRACPVTRLRVA